MSIQGMKGPGGGGRHFARIDKNSDGQLDRSELETFAQKISEKTGQTVTADDLMAKMDADGDGSVSQQELRNSRPPRRPPPMQGDTMTTEELSSMASHMSQRTGETISPEQLLQQLDANSDGEVSREEMHAHRQQMKNDIGARMQALRMRNT